MKIKKICDALNLRIFWMNVGIIFCIISIIILLCLGSIFWAGIVLIFLLGFFINQQRYIDYYIHWKLMKLSDDDTIDLTENSDDIYESIIYELGLEE